MSPFEAGLTESLQHLSEGADDQATQRVIARAHADLRRRRRSRVIMFGSGAAAAAVLVTGLNAGGLIPGGGSSGSPGQVAGAGLGPQGSTQHSAPQGSEFVMPSIPPGQPCAYAHGVTLAQLPTLVASPVWMPDTADASVSNLAGAWVCTGDGALTFANGVTVTYESGWSGVPDPAAKWAEIVAQRKAGSVGTVLGQSALLGPPGSAYPFGEVLVVVDGDTLMRLWGNGKLPLTQLIDIANSINPQQPLPHT